MRMEDTGVHSTPAQSAWAWACCLTLGEHAATQGASFPGGWKQSLGTQGW